MHIEMLKAIAQEAQNKLARVYELYDLGEPPSVTPGIVDMVLRVAEQHEPAVPKPSTPHPPESKSKIVTAPSDDVESAVIARLRELAVDGQMPTQATFDEQHGDLPKSKDLWQRFDKRGWSEWAALAGLAYVGKRGVRRKARKTEAPAPTPEAAFRGAQVSDKVARYAVNGAPVGDAPGLVATVGYLREGDSVFPVALNVDHQ